jgi:hypothetical protein
LVKDVMMVLTSGALALVMLVWIFASCGRVKKTSSEGGHVGCWWFRCWVVSVGWDNEI